MNGYLKYNPGTSTHGRFVQASINQVLGGRNQLQSILATFSQMVISTGGDGSQDADYAVVATAIGAPDNATAHGISDELNSLYGKLSTDATTDHVATAISQAVAKLLI